MIRRPPRSTLFPYRRSSDLDLRSPGPVCAIQGDHERVAGLGAIRSAWLEHGCLSVEHRCAAHGQRHDERSEEHTSELQSQSNLVCRLLLEKKKNKTRRA